MFREKNILIIEDDKLNADLLINYLEDLSYKFISVESGEKGLEYIKENNIYLVLLDIVLPKMNGYQVCEKIKNDKSTEDIPVIFISSLDKSKNIAKGFEVGGSDYLTKPFEKEVVRARVKHHLKFYETKNELKRKNKEQNILLENIDAQVWYLKDEYTYGKTNKKHADFLGLEKGKIEDKKLSDFLAEEEAEICAYNTAQVFNKKEKTKTLEKVKNHAGEKKLLNITKQPVFNDDGNIEYVVATASDITKEYEQKKELSNQRNRLNMVIEGTNLGTWEWNIQTREAVLNKKWAEMLGYKLKELEPTTIDTLKHLTHPDDLENVEEILKKHIEGDKTLFVPEFRMKHKDGHWVWIQSRGKVMSFSDDNKALKMFGIHIDITERKKREEKMNFLAAAMANISDSVMITDNNFKIQYINEAGENLFGYPIEEIKGKTPGIFNAEANASEIQEDIYKDVSNGNVYKTEFLNKRKDGSTFICEMKANPLKNDEGEIYAHTGIQRDISKRKKQKEELELQHQFQKTLAEITSNLLQVNSANIDRKISNALKKIGEFSGIDRSYIFMFSNGKEKMSNTHEWCDKNLDCQKDKLQNLASNTIPWCMEKLSKNEIINIADVKKMKKAAKAEQKILEEQNINSVVVIPMFIESELFGFFGFDLLKKRKGFSAEQIEKLKIFTDVIISAFSKHLNDEKIRELTFKDSLTELYNRRYFDNELERIDTERHLPMSIIIADINGLKIINDSFGHKTGDDVLIKSANILKEATREEDILARQGGDEFAILLPKTSASEALEIIDRINKKSNATKTDKLTVSIALGTATKTEFSQNIDDVLKTADNNMYQNKLSEGRSTKNKIVQGLLNSLAVKSDETKEHTVRMTKLALKFGKRLALSNSELNRLSLLATLHDIGKITIEEKLLTKAGDLTEEEWKIMKSHTERGYKIASSSEEFALVAEEIYSHHERWDGHGYPRKIQGNEILYLARIISIIDAYDVMTNDRPYTKAISKKEALEEINNCAGSQFDPVLAQEFIEMIK